MSAVRMTEGRVQPLLIRYAIPLILGNMFQLTYNAVDSAIVGQFVSKEALAAVGTSSPILNMMVLGISGLCVGAGVIMSEAFGRHDESTLRKELAMTLIAGFTFASVVMVLGIALTEPLLRLMAVPEEVMALTAAYLRVVLLGLPFTCLYNAMAQGMKSVGDTKTPLYFLIFSSVLNALLDVVFVAWLRMGAVSSAATTVFAQAASAMLCLWHIRRRIPLLRLRKADWQPDKALMKRTISFGGTTALQSACQPIGKLMIQTVVNNLGVDAMACFNAVTRMDDYACLPAQSISQASSTFIAQNRGAGKYDRIRTGYLNALRLELCWWPIIGLVTWLCRLPIMRAFVTAGNEAVITTGCTYLGWMALIYLCPCLTNGCQSYFRGMGHMKLTLLNTFIQISLRVLFVYLLVPTYGLTCVAFASCIGWCGMLALDLPLTLWNMQRLRKGTHPLQLKQTAGKAC